MPLQGCLSRKKQETQAPQATKGTGHWIRCSFVHFNSLNSLSTLMNLSKTEELRGGGCGIRTNVQLWAGGPPLGRRSSPIPDPLGDSAANQASAARRGSRPRPGRAPHSPSALSRVRWKSSERPSRKARQRDRQRKSSIQPAATASASATRPASSSSSEAPKCTWHSNSSWHSNCSWPSLAVSAIRSSGEPASSPSASPRGLGAAEAVLSAILHSGAASVFSCAEWRLACAARGGATGGVASARGKPPITHHRDGRAARTWLLIGRNLLPPLDVEFPATQGCRFVGKLDKFWLDAERE